MIFKISNLRDMSLRPEPVLRPPGAGLSHQRGVLFLAQPRRSAACSTASPPSASMRGRFRGGAVPRFDRGQCDGPRRRQGQPSGHPAVHHRRVADCPASAAQSGVRSGAQRAQSDVRSGARVQLPVQVPLPAQVPDKVIPLAPRSLDGPAQRPSRRTAVERHQ